MRKVFLLLLSLMLASAPCLALGEPGTTTIAIQVGDASFSGTLYENDAASALVELLPLTLDMSDLNGNEKYYYLPEDLPANSTSPGHIQSGDLMLYGGNCLVLFYEDFDTGYSYTPLGRLVGHEGLAEALGRGNVSVAFSIQTTLTPSLHTQDDSI